LTIKLILRTQSTFIGLAAFDCFLESEYSLLHPAMAPASDQSELISRTRASTVYL
jgi:hypothetical protein